MTSRILVFEAMNSSSSTDKQWMYGVSHVNVVYEISERVRGKGSRLERRRWPTVINEAWLRIGVQCRRGSRGKLCATWIGGVW